MSSSSSSPTSPPLLPLLLHLPRLLLLLCNRKSEDELYHQCYNCLKVFSRENELIAHENNCQVVCCEICRKRYHSFHFKIHQERCKREHEKATELSKIQHSSNSDSTTIDDSVDEGSVIDDKHGEDAEMTRFESFISKTLVRTTENESILQSETNIDIAVSDSKTDIMDSIATNEISKIITDDKDDGSKSEKEEFHSNQNTDNPSVTEKLAECNYNEKNGECISNKKNLEILNEKKEPVNVAKEDNDSNGKLKETRHTLKKNVKNVNKENGSNHFNCNICGEQISARSELAKHLISHFKCNHCGKRFPTVEKVKVHQDTHNL